MARQQDPWDLGTVVSPAPGAQQQAASPWDQGTVVQPAQATQTATAPARQPSAAYTPVRQFRAPVAGAQVSAFGQREAPKAGASTNHQGIDLRAAVGEPVSAAGDGEVIFAGPRGNYGNRVVVRHADGTETTYSHLSNIGVQVGQRIGAGAPLGAAGATGNVTGPHVHFEVMRDGQYVDPNDWLMGADDIAAQEIVTPDMTAVAFEEAPASVEATPLLGTRENPVDITNRDQVQQAKKGDWVRLANGDLTRAAGEAVQGEAGTEQAPGIYARESNLIDSIGAGATAAGEQIPFLDEAAAGVVGLTSGLGYDAIRDRQRAIIQTDNQQYRPARVAGGIAGFTAGLAAPGGGYIRGATGLSRAARAAQVGAAYGGLYGAGAADDSYASRLSGLGQGAVIGAATGGLTQMGLDRLAGISSGAATSARPSQARRLSRAGIDLTPGQMAAEVPLIGGALRALEEGASSIPVAGAAISGARQRGVEQFNRTVVNQALAPIGRFIPESVPVGQDMMREAQTILNQAYDDVLTDVQIVPDQTLYDGLGSAINSAVEGSGAPGARRIAREIQERVFRYLGDDAATPINGQQFKALESEFTALANNALGATDGATRAVGRAYQAVNDTLREALEAQNPGRREALRAVNEAYARMVRPETAAASSASQAAEGVFTPTQLGVAVASQSGRRASARGDALMQELVGPGRGILNSRLGDSGTATRGAVTALASGAAGTATVMNPQVAIPVIAGVSALYSRPAQRALNAIYRSTDNPGAAQRHLARLASLAQRDPALQPYYQEAVRFVTGQEPLRPQERDARSQTQEQRLAG